MATNPFLEEARRRDALVGQIPTGGQRQAPAADGSQGNILNNDLGRNLAALPSVGNIPGAALRGTGLVARAFGAAQPAMSGVGQAAQAAAPYAPVVAGGAVLAGAANADSPSTTPPPMARPVSPLVQAALDNPVTPSPASAAAPAPAAAPATTSNVSRIGNSYSGTDVAGDISINGSAPRGSVTSLPAGAAPSGFGGPLVQAAGIRPWGSDRPGFSIMDNPLVARALGGGPSAQNMGAADNLAAQGNIESMARLRASGQIASPGPGPSMSLSGGTLGIRRAPSIVASELGAQRGFDRAEGRDPASLQRATSIYQALLQQQGQNQRAGMQAGLDQQRINMDRETQGFTNRRQSIVEALRNQVAQEPDPTKRRSIVQYMRDVEGAQTPSDWDVKVTPTTKNVDGSTTMGSVIRHNRATGQVEHVPMGQGGGQPPSRDSLVRGQIYQTPRGQARWNGTAFDPV
ncbi:hypothetical protein JC796_17480 [Delftia acidovorans]|uniref:hypothetical protein n=1 Tax=Delftia acidovorans TaxID=80866 RepID=UPI0018E7B00E|nr:hypothetical protein [Delftia acidovorans]MBJ2142538.1 hypothetical protein [Delftia acidovorans]